mmetsp:Transcript_63912/g.119907  ORF Transcript_63912/g.119907 Transcript_63912/m.119907 type:complete len:331 (-) Transcript_63912:2264-3256(-)
MLSVPQSVNATDSGHLSSLSCLRRSKSLFTTERAQSTAAAVGMLWGSKACMFLPVGSTSGLRIGSPPGPGVMYLPSSADMSAPNSLSATICFRQNSRYANRSPILSSAMSKPSANKALRHSVPPVMPAMAEPMPLKKPDTSSMRPSALVEAFTDARTATRVATLIFSFSSTISRRPLLLSRYTSSIFKPLDCASKRGRPTNPSSGRSSSAMFTRVAMASSAVGGTPTVCSPQGSRRDSISMRRRYTLPTTWSRPSRSISFASASSAGRSKMSLSRLQLRAEATIEFTMLGPRAPFSRRPLYDDTSSPSSFRPLYRPAFSAGGGRDEMVAL